VVKDLHCRRRNAASLNLIVRHNDAINFEVDVESCGNVF
jgi:hypothetical protein